MYRMGLNRVGMVRVSMIKWRCRRVKGASTPSLALGIKRPERGVFHMQYIDLIEMYAIF